MEGIVVGISETKYKTYHNITYENRYITVITPDEGRVLVSTSEQDLFRLPRDKDGIQIQMKNGDIVNFDHFQKEIKFPDVVMRTNPQIILLGWLVIPYEPLWLSITLVIIGFVPLIMAILFQIKGGK